MIGTTLNAAGILLGAAAGLTLARQPSMRVQVTLKALLGMVTVLIGLRITWLHLGDGPLGMLKGLAIVIAALIAGRLLGRLLRLQKGLNKLGRYAKERMSRPQASPRQRFNDGFITAALLFSVNPMATLGALEDGLGDHWPTLGIKAILDGLTAMAFVSTFGWGVLLAVFPVIAFQGAVTVGAHLLEPYLQAYGLIDSVHAACGMLIFCLALIILEIKKVEVADYFPSLIIAPLIAAVWR